MSTAGRKLDLGAVTALLPKLHPSDVGFVELEAKQFVFAEGNLTYSIAHGEAQWNRVDRVLLAIFPLAVTIEIIDGDERRAIAGISVTARVAYQLDESFTEDDAVHLDDYVGTQGRLLAWSYQRAEVQSLSTKLGIPALTLPLLYVGQTLELPVARFEGESDTASA